MKIERTTYPGWSDYPCFYARTYEDYCGIKSWMCQHQVENFMLSSGSAGYVFQVKSNIEWFLLRWTE